MGIVRSAVRASASSMGGIATPEKDIINWITGGVESASGVIVDQETALHYSAFFGGVRVISEDLGGLPLFVYERLERGKRRATEHQLYGLLHDQPNDMMTSVQLRETLQGHALTWGDGVAYLVTHPRTGTIEEIWPLRPDRIRIKVRRMGNGRFERFYDYFDEVNGIAVRLRSDEVLHISGLGFNGVHGYSVVEHGRNSIGLGLATERYGSAFFGNGSRPGGVLSHPGEVPERARKRISADWENLHKGLDRAQRIAILEEGVTWQQIGIAPEDAQFLETRKLQVTEMARWLRLPPHKIGDLERATFANIEEQQLDYVTSALRIWLVRWEQAILTQLFAAEERRRFFAEHLVDGLLRGDTMKRYQAYAVGRNWGWLSADDVRELENQNPIPEGRGEVYLVPLNMVPAPRPEDADVIDGEIVEDDDKPGATRAIEAARDARGRGLASRRRIAQSFSPLIKDADRRLVKLEHQEISSLVRRHLTRSRSTSAFIADVEDLYQGPIRERMTERWRPIITAFAAEIAADAAADVGHDDEVDLTRWSAAYTASHVGYRVNSSIGQLRRIVEGAATVEEAADAVTTRIGEWVEKRPGKTVGRQTIQLPNAAARQTYNDVGVTRLQWMAFGDCPYCTSLDGAIVGISETFLAAGEEIQDGDQKLSVSNDVFHPPAHQGCVCQIVPA